MKKETIEEVSKDFDEVVNRGRQLLEEAELQEHFDEIKTEAELLIRKHPVKSVLVGVAAGFILAKLLRG